MSENIDQVHVVLADFDGSCEIWRAGVFDSEDEARDAWDARDSMLGEAKWLRLVTICVRSDGGVHTIGEAPRL